MTADTETLNMTDLYVARSDEQVRQMEDLVRLGTQEKPQNEYSARFLTRFFPQKSIPVDQLMILFSGSSSVLEKLLPLLRKNGKVIANDTADVKIAAFHQRAEALGIAHENTNGLKGRAVDILKEMPDSSFNGLVHARLGLLWDPGHEETVKELAKVMAPGSFFMVEDMNLSTWRVDPPLESFDVLHKLLTDWRAGLGDENEMGVKIPKICVGAGLEIIATNSYQMESHNGEDPHWANFGILGMSRAGILHAGLIDAESFDRHMGNFKKHLEDHSTVMWYPQMIQVLAQKPLA